MKEKIKKLSFIILKVISWFAFLWGSIAVIAGIFIMNDDHNIDILRKWKFYAFAVLPFLFFIFIIKDVKKYFSKFISESNRFFGNCLIYH